MNPLKLNTTSVSFAVTPTVVSTLFSHYLNRKVSKQRPDAHLSYDEGLHLVRSFLEFASHHTVEELQAFTAQWVPHPQWVKVEDVAIPEAQIERSAELIEGQLGPAGVQAVGGRKWWKWRKPQSPLKAEWVEMRADYHERKKNGGATKRVMLYVHGGAYFFGSVDEHRYQMQRHARKLKARVFAPRYRLAPQFPFPCGLQDCLAAYLYLLTVQDPTTIVLAGDSAGGGMVLSILCILRDQGIPLPAGAVLISPWVDLTHSFPSVSGDNALDYIPSSGFHHKPSRAWPPPNEDDMEMMREQAIKARAGKEKSATKLNTLEKKQAPPIALNEEGGAVEGNPNSSDNGDPRKTALQISVTINGELITVKDQIQLQLYTTNALLSHPLVSPVMQPTLGGLPPLLIMVGGGEVLRDEQIYLAHKCANPAKYPPPGLDKAGLAQLQQYKPTDVQLQVWDDLCHVAPTLSFTRPAKHMYRAAAQFGAWALARAQQAEVEILDDDDISEISSSASDSDNPHQEQTETPSPPEKVGKAGMPLPSFKKHMIRQRITTHGVVHDLAPESELPGCTMKLEDVGLVKETPVRRWLNTKAQFDKKFSSAKAKVHKSIIKDLADGYIDFGDGEKPPPAALAGRRKASEELIDRKKTKSIGLALWSLWGSKHDETTMGREKKGGSDAKTNFSQVSPRGGEGARSFEDVENQEPVPVESPGTTRRVVMDENQTLQASDSQVEESLTTAAEETPVAALIEMRKEQEKQNEEAASAAGHQDPDFVAGTGVAGKRPFLDGIALPFSLGKKDAETASMMTLMSGGDSRPISPMPPMSRAETSDLNGASASEATTQVAEAEHTRPQLDNFVTAAEDLPLAKGKGKEVVNGNVEQTA
ncbi:AB hydrolase superfamily protein [Colletotrichum spaethianum]|uniref:AB hydrolase superfamily protein n=1 Tax=Colletotrichum spaethianum TaxID=700344 RepID=A0AA37LDL4_9PEZI|nr:AB hydrolase superfamily protein [Colletotrichum spaethianum]GKT46547.1 AB hydrolase superfamily protein [Colletotrichum spaethianum]